MPLKMKFPFKFTIALGTRKTGPSLAFVLQVKNKRGLFFVRQFTLAALERGCSVGAVL